MTHKYAKPAPFPVPERHWPERDFELSPIWCAVDLRDGNQALPDPMTPAQKRRYFRLLCDIGFKEIEIGFPSASSEDFQFCRDLIEENLIPEGVTISVLTAAREDLIRKTAEALQGASRAMIHMYIATSKLHMEYVFHKTPEEVKDTAVNGVKLIRELADTELKDSEIGLEFSPEEFTDGDLYFNVEVCDAVVDAWGGTPDDKVVLNLPATVERRPPNHYADMIESFIHHQHHTDSSIVSVHSHNDMGCAVAATEMTLLAGAGRVEGTMFGHGERCGNVDLVTLALNLQYMGVDTGLDFGRLDEIRDEIVELTGMPVHARQPYAGELVFTAFSGSHQDAIYKGLNQQGETQKDFGGWKIPYLHIDPGHIGRDFERFVRINSQSGKGGIAYVLQSDFGLRLPRELLKDFSPHVQAMAEKNSKELDSSTIWNLFKECYVFEKEPMELIRYWPNPLQEDPMQIAGRVEVKLDGDPHTVEATAGGPISAFVRAIRKLNVPDFRLEEYEEDALSSSADAEAVTFVRIEGADSGESFFGVGFGINIDQAAVQAIVSALNQLMLKERASEH